MTAGSAGNNGPVTRILVVDNYDSFVYNLVQYLAQLGAEVVVLRNDEVTAQEALNFVGLFHHRPGLHRGFLYRRLLNPDHARPEFLDKRGHRLWFYLCWVHSVHPLALRPSSTGLSPAWGELHECN